jgi:hypothetical protein
MTTKMGLTKASLSHTHFIEQLAGVTEKPPQKHNENLEKLEL